MLKRFLKHLYWWWPILLFSAALADDGVWEKIDSNPYKIGTVQDISIGYASDNTQYIFAATSSELCWLWKTTDQGQHWNWSFNVADHVFTRVVIEAGNFDCGWTLVPSNAGNTDNDAGPYRTLDFGSSWNLRDNGLQNCKKLWALAADQSSPNLEIAFVGGEGSADNGYQKLFKTSDGGLNWTLSQNGIPANEQGIIYDIAVSKSDADVIYSVYEGGSQSGIYRSTNGGTDWNWLATSEFDLASAIAVHPSHPELVAIIEKAPNLGRVWESLNATSDNPTWELMGRLEPNIADATCLKFDKSGQAWAGIINILGEAEITCKVEGNR